jgi:hypothetical protein
MNNLILNLDAKNSQYSKTFDPHPNRTQMDSYIRSTNARCRIFIHSRSGNPETWEERLKKIIRELFGHVLFLVIPQTLTITTLIVNL